jgi:hypothetical protein
VNNMNEQRTSGSHYQRKSVRTCKVFAVDGSRQCGVKGAVTVTCGNQESRRGVAISSRVESAEHARCLL